MRGSAASPTGARGRAESAIRSAVAALPLVFAAASSHAGEPTALTLVHGQAGEETLELTLSELAGLPHATVVTENPFVDGAVAYRGPLVRSVIEPLALAQGEILRFTAANEYYVDIPTNDFFAYDVILATEADGVPLTRRDKGPLWLMYPLSDNPELRKPVYVDRLIWQVVQIAAK